MNFKFSTRNVNFLGILASLLAMLFWSINPYIVKHILIDINIESFLLLKYGTPTILFIFLLPSILKKAEVSSKFPLIVLGLAISVCNVTLVLGLSKTSGILYIIFFSCTPILTLLFSKNLKSFQIIISSLLAFSGCFFFLRNDRITHSSSLEGILYLMISTISWIIVTLNIKRIQNVYSDLEITYFFNFVSFLTSILIYCLSSEKFESFNRQTFTLLTISLILSPVGSWLFTVSLRYSFSFCVSSQYLQLIFGLIIGGLFFEEISTYWQWLGGFLIILALFINTKKESLVS